MTDKKITKMKGQENQIEDNMPEIPGMELNRYSTKPPVMPAQDQKLQEAMDKTKKELEKLKGTYVKKFPFIQAIGIIPQQAVKLFIEDELGENVTKEQEEPLLKKVHLYVIIPEEKFKEIPKIKKELVAEADKAKQNLWIHLKTPVDVWESSMDSKFDLVNAVGMSYPLYDKGMLEALRVAEIHKTLVLQKFDKYVVSYIIAGSMVRGDATKESDIDVFVVINDTDVKRMPRLELKERLRGMIYKYIAEANALAGVKKNMLNVQLSLLTDFWERVKDAEPVVFTFIRDGVPLYDRGTFLPWKALLKMGRLKPSPEAIDMFMSMGDKTVKRAKATLLDILIHDIYWGVLTPSQALLMLYGLPPPTPKQTVPEMKRVFVEKEKMLEKKYVNILERIVNIYKSYEHEKVKEITGTELDSLIKGTEEYIDRLKELRKQIEKRAQEKTLDQINKDIFGLLEAILGKKAQAALISGFEDLVKKGKFTQQHAKILKEVIQAKAQFKKGKLESHKVDETRKNATVLINELIEYSQRADLLSLEKSRMRIKFKKSGKEKLGELLNCKGASFLFVDRDVKKITSKIENSNMNEVSTYLEQQKSDRNIEISPKIFELVKKELGDFDIVL